MAVEDTTLGCGHTIEQVWANITHPPTPHEIGCSQCQAARESLRTLNELTEEHREAERFAETTPEASQRPSARVHSTVLAIARAEVRRGRRIRVATTEYGPILISEQTLLALVRTAVDTVNGMRARRISASGLIDTQAPFTGAEGSNPGARITCRVAVAPAVSIPAATAAARQRILAATSWHLQLEPEAVDIIVEDLYEH